jgi:curved DNA-binding protein CbpA
MPASAAGIREFTAYRVARETEVKRLWEADQGFSRQQAEEARQREEAQRRREEEQARQEQEELERLLREWRRICGGFAAEAGSDCWSVLGLSPTATLEEVKGRYRQLAREHHPDRFGDEEAFKRVSAAYEQACKILACR